MGIEVFFRDAAEERGDLDLVVYIYAGGAAADGVDTGQVGGGALKGILYALEVILGVGLEVRIPDDFFAEDDLAVMHGGYFTIGAAEVETDTAAFEMASQGC